MERGPTVNLSDLTAVTMESRRPHGHGERLSLEIGLATCLLSDREVIDFRYNVRGGVESKAGASGTSGQLQVAALEY